MCNQLFPIFLAEVFKSIYNIYHSLQKNIRLCIYLPCRQTVNFKGKGQILFIFLFSKIYGTLPVISTVRWLASLLPFSNTFNIKPFCISATSLDGNTKSTFDHTLHILSSDSHKLAKKVTFSFLFYRWENEGSERLDELPKVTELVISAARTQTQIFSFPAQHSYLLNFSYFHTTFTLCHNLVSFQLLSAYHVSSYRFNLFK